MFDENGLGDHRTNSVRTAESGKCNDKMDEKDNEIANLGIVARSATAGNCGVNCLKLVIRQGHDEGTEFSISFGGPNL
jgi:hypothetical protein